MSNIPKGFIPRGQAPAAAAPAQGSNIPKGFIPRGSSEKPPETGEALPQGSVEVSDFPGSGWLGMKQTYSGPEQNVAEYKRGGKSPEQAGLHYEGERKRTGRDTAGDVAQIVSDVTSTVNPITAVAGPMLTRAGKVATGQSDQGYGEALTEGATAAGTNLLLGGIGSKAAGAAGAGVRKVAGETAGKVVETALSGAPALGKKALGAAAEKVLGKSTLAKPFVGTAKAVGAGAGTAAALEAPHGQLPTSTEIEAATALEAIPVAGRMFRRSNKVADLARGMQRPHLLDKTTAIEGNIEKGLAAKYGTAESQIAEQTARNKPGVLGAKAEAEDAAAYAATAKADVSNEKLKLAQERDQATAGAQAEMAEKLKLGENRAVEITGQSAKKTTENTHTTATAFKSGDKGSRQVGTHMFGFAADILAPDQLTAQAVRHPKFAGLVEIFRSKLGKAFLHEDVGASIELRRKHLNNMIRQNGEEWAGQVGHEISTDSAKWLLATPEIGLTPLEERMAARVATGTATNVERIKVMSKIQDTLHATVTSPELKAANMEYKGARAGADTARAGYLNSGAKAEQGGLKKAAADIAAMKAADPLSRQLESVRRRKIQLGGAPTGGGALGSQAIAGATGLPGARTLAAGAPGFVRRVANTAEYGLGKLVAGINDAPANIQAKIRPVLNKVGGDGNKIRMALVNLAMHDPELMAWLREQQNVQK